MPDQMARPTIGRSFAEFQTYSPSAATTLIAVVLGLAVGFR